MIYIQSDMQNDTNDDKTTWDPMEIFFGSSNHEYAVVVLNQPILLAKSLVLPMWRRGKFYYSILHTNNVIIINTNNKTIKLIIHSSFLIQKQK